VNYKDIVLDGKKRTVFLKKEGMAIGLGAIAKGYAVDRAALVLAKEGIRDSIVRAGSDMRVQGLENGKPWEIGIKHPGKRTPRQIRPTDLSVSTSGDYERFSSRTRSFTIT
jgi:thiamine biosynthesis lipoprotein